MDMRQFLKNFEVKTLLVDGVTTNKAAGTGDTLTSNSFDTLGYAAFTVLFVLGVNTAGGASSFRLQNSNDDAVLDAYADVAGSKYTFLDGDTLKSVGRFVYRPLADGHSRYWKVLTTRATQNLAINSLIVILHRKHPDLPITAGTTMTDTGGIVSPARGTP